MSKGTNFYTIKICICRVNPRVHTSPLYNTEKIGDYLEK